MKNIFTNSIVFIACGLVACGFGHGQKKLRAETKDLEIVKGFLFGEDRPFPQCHASTIIHLDGVRFMAAWFGGTAEKNNDVGIWLTQGVPGNWDKPKLVAKINNEPHWNPVLFKTPQGDIHLYFKVGMEIPSWQTYQTISKDKGQTWSRPTELAPGDKGGRGPVRNKILVLTDGAWLAGASHEEGQWDVFFDRSTDKGKTWTATPYLELNREIITGKGVIQPTLWESSPGNVHALLRSSAGVVCRTDSKDGGKTWSPVYKTSLPNPNSGIDVVKLKDGTLILAYNPDDQNWGSRGKLALALSDDNGATWKKRVMIEDGKKGEEYSYPAIIATGDSVALTYTWNREKIAFWLGTKNWILNHANTFQ